MFKTDRRPWVSEGWRTWVLEPLAISLTRYSDEPELTREDGLLGCSWRQRGLHNRTGQSSGVWQPRPLPTAVQWWSVGSCLAPSSPIRPCSSICCLSACPHRFLERGRTVCAVQGSPDPPEQGPGECLWLSRGRTSYPGLLYHAPWRGRCSQEHAGCCDDWLLTVYFLLS